MFLSRPRSGASLALLLGAAVGLAPLPVAAKDRVRILPTLAVSQEYSSDAVRSGGDEQGDFITRVTPLLKIRSEGESGYTELGAGANMRFHADVSDLDSVDPFGSMDFERALTRRLAFFGEGSVYSRESIDPAEEDGERIVNGRPDLTQAMLMGGLRLAIDRRSSASLSLRGSEADYGTTEFTRGARRDQQARSATLSYGRLVTPRDQLTGSLSWQDTHFDRRPAEPGIPARTDQDDRVTAWSLGWDHRWTRGWRSSLVGGIRLLTSEGSGFRDFVPIPLDHPAGDLSLDESSRAFTGNAQITRTTKRSVTRLSLRSETRPSSGLSGSVDFRAVSASYVRALGPRFELRVSGLLQWQESASEFYQLSALGPGECRARGGVFGLLRGIGFLCAAEGGSEVDTEFQQANVRLSWRPRKRLSTFVRYGYSRQDSQGLTGGSFDDHTFVVGFRYSYDIDLP